MGFLWFKPNVEKLRAKGDARGLVDALNDSDHRDEAVAALISLGERALDAVVARMADEEAHMHGNDEALAKVAALIGPPAVDPLLSLLVQGPDQAKRRALDALGRLGGPRAAAAIQATFLGSADWVKGAALRALVSLTGNEHIDLVVEALSDTSALVRKQAAEMLGELGDARAVPALRSLWARVAALDLDAISFERTEEILGQPPPTEDPRNRRMLNAFSMGQLHFALAGSLAMLGDRKALEALLRSVESRDNSLMRSKAATQLGRVGGVVVLAALAEALHDPERDVRRKAIAALGVARDPEARRILEDARAAAAPDDRARMEAALKQG